MKNITAFYNNNELSENNQNLYLYFNLGDNKYAINTQNVVEIMKLPMLDYPQKLPNNIVGLLNYNNFTINILDLRFYLNLKVEPYSVLNQLLVVKTDETIFGIIIDKVEDIISLNPEKIEPFSVQGADKIIEFLYKKDSDSIAAISPLAIENLLKQGVESVDMDIKSLFPTDDDSRFKLVQRNQALQEKFQANLDASAFAKNQFATFLINECKYCIDLKYIKEFIKNPLVTKIPCNIPYIDGVITLRGDFITVLDFEKFLDIEMVSDKKNKKNVVVIEASDYFLGIAVDEILDIIEIQEELIQINSQNKEKYVLSEVVMNNDFYTILDMKSVLADDRLFVDESF